MKYRIQMPGKTFFFGEYAALEGGSALLLSTGPGFEMNFSKGVGEGNCFHLESPAGLYYSQNQSFFRDWSIHFSDFYNGSGGFGASTAQFIGLALFRKYIQAPESLLSSDQTFKDIWSEYQIVNLRDRASDNFAETLAQLPSGYDLWAQCLGAISGLRRQSISGVSDDFSSFVRNEVSFVSRTLDWPFPDLEFALVPTGNKIATHDHLKNIQKSSFEKLVRMSDSLMIDFIDGAEKRFFDTLNMWNLELESLGLVHPRTIEILQSLRIKSDVVFSKGCGALGADVILIVYESKNRDRIQSTLASLNLKNSFGMKDLWPKEVTVQSC